MWKPHLCMCSEFYWVVTLPFVLCGSKCWTSEDRHRHTDTAGSTLQVTGRDSLDGVTTYYRLDVRGFKSRLKQEISSSSSPSWPALDPNHPLLQWAPAKRPVCGIDHPASSRAEVKNALEVYVYSRSDPPITCCGWSNIIIIIIIIIIINCNWIVTRWQ